MWIPHTFFLVLHISNSFPGLKYSFKTHFDLIGHQVGESSESEKHLLAGSPKLLYQEILELGAVLTLLSSHKWEWTWSSHALI